jgi:hypothetical protein
MTERDVEAMAAQGVTRIVVSPAAAGPRARREELSAFAERFGLRQAATAGVPHSDLRRAVPAAGSAGARGA